MPIPRHVRERLELEEWRHRIWQAEHKYLGLLDPQFRELFRKMNWTMNRAGLPQMAGNFYLGLFTIWMFTGSVRKMEEFILHLWNGGVLLIDMRAIGQINPHTDLPEPELRKSLLLYTPYSFEPLAEVSHRHAKPFTDFLGTLPIERPWVAEWFSELEALRRQTTAEFGEELAAKLWAKSTFGRTLGNDCSKPSPQNHAAPAKVAYW